MIGGNKSDTGVDNNLGMWNVVEINGVSLRLLNELRPRRDVLRLDDQNLSRNH